jgi:hypothetical protein
MPLLYSVYFKDNVYVRPVWFLLFPSILEFIKNIVRFVLILPAILDVQSSLLSINMCNWFFHVRNYIGFVISLWNTNIIICFRCLFNYYVISSLQLNRNVNITYTTFFNPGMLLCMFTSLCFWYIYIYIYHYIHCTVSQ